MAAPGKVFGVEPTATGVGAAASAATPLGPLKDGLLLLERLPLRREAGGEKADDGSGADAVLTTEEDRPTSLSPLLEERRAESSLLAKRLTDRALGSRGLVVLLDAPPTSRLSSMSCGEPAAGPMACNNLRVKANP